MSSSVDHRYQNEMSDVSLSISEVVSECSYLIKLHQKKKANPSDSTDQRFLVRYDEPGAVKSNCFRVTFTKLKLKSDRVRPAFALSKHFSSGGKNVEALIFMENVMLRV